MKLLLDQNLSYKLEKQLSAFFPDVRHVKTLGLYNALDADIWAYARRNGFSILTQDADFNDLGLLQGFPPKIIWLRARNLKTSEVTWLLQQHAEEIKVFLRNPDVGILEVFSLKK